MNKVIKAVDLFCGGGGLSQGLRDAGIDVVLAMDAWPAAINFYRANQLGHSALRQDLTAVEETIAKLREYSFDMIAGGPPCQDFSSAGKRDGNGSRANLTTCYARIVIALRPQYFIMENVDLARKYATFRDAVEALRQAGYGITERVLDASLCGVPQKRKRTIVWGVLNGKDDALADIILSSLSKKAMTIRDYFGKLWPVEFYYRHPRSYARRGVFSIDEPSPTIRGVNRPVPKGYKQHPNDAAPPNSVRALTTRERALLQTFPAKWRLVGTKSEVEQIVGNAVPVRLAEFVGRCLLAYMRGQIAIENFWRNNASEKEHLLFSQEYDYPYEDCCGQLCVMEPSKDENET